jgi:hypothetical protein
MKKTIQYGAGKEGLFTHENFLKFMEQQKANLSLARDEWYLNGVKVQYLWDKRKGEMALKINLTGDERGISRVESIILDEFYKGLYKDRTK